MRRSKRFWLGGAALIAIALVGVWSARRPIADNAIRSALAARDVPASYVVRDIGFRTQRLERIVIGDPARPDLTAAWAEVSLVPHWGGVRVTAVRASGVRLHGRQIGGRVSWGALNKLLPVASGKRFMLPGIDAELHDVRVLLTSDYGNVGVRIDGRGRLDDGFVGKAVVASSKLGQGACAGRHVRAFVDLTVIGGKPRLAGPVRAAGGSCNGVEVAAPSASLDARLTPSFQLVSADATVDAGRVAANGATLISPRVKLIARSEGQVTTLRINATAPTGSYRGSQVDGLAFVGGGGLLAEGWSLRGTTSFARYRPDARSLADVRQGFTAVAGSPVGPLAARLSQALAGLAQGVSGKANIAVERLNESIAFAFDEARLSAGSGAQLRFDLAQPPIGIVPTNATRSATLRLIGGGFPTATATLREAAPGNWRGIAYVEPLTAPGASLALAPVRIFARTDGAVRIQSETLLSGPLGDGRVERLRLPLTIRRTAGGVVRVVPDCQRISFERAAFAGALLRDGSALLCPTSGDALLTVANGRVSGGAKTGPLRLTGSVGGQPLIMTGRTLAFALNGPLTASDMTVALGPEQRRTRLQVGRVVGRFGPNGISGKFGGLSGAIARVLLVVDQGTGDWRIAHGRLAIDGGMKLSDAAATARFKPLIADDVTLRFGNGRIDAVATLKEPVSGRAVTRVALNHDLGQAAGGARLTVDGLTFGKSLQPEAITPLTLGVVADVQGRINGSGLVRWRGETVTSSGRFRTDALDLAAAFGPVTGISGEIEFDDLIALRTPPGQQLRVGGINPGVEVTGGTISYRLRPNQVVDIEQGRWPFAGGELLLAPATLDFGREGARKLIFRIVALDAAKFIEQIKLENIAATGIFDGDLPIVFDTAGGRIVGGRLVARGPGTLAYVGDVSNAQTNTMAKLAFDALKSIRYDVLAIDLDGALDGEIVSRVGFTGVNDAPVAPTGLARSLTGLPFKFNIVVRAPFRGLVNTARTFQDPGLLLNRPIQPAESGRRP